MRLQVTDIRTLTADKPDVRYFEFRGGTITVGSHSNMLLQIPDVELPSHYANIERDGEKWMYKPTTREDGLSTINEQPVRGETELKNGDVLQITRFEVRIEIEPEGAEIIVTQPGKAGELALIKQYPVPPRTLIRKPAELVKLAAARQRSLAKIVSKLSECRTLPELMETTLRELESELEARMSWLGIRRKPSDELEFMDGRLEGAVAMTEPPKKETYVYRCLSRHQHIMIPRTGDGVTQAVLAVPIMRGEDAIGLLYVDSKRHARVYDDADLDFITLVAALLQPLLDRALEQQAPLQAAGTPTAGPGVGAGADPALLHELRDRIVLQKLPQWSTLELARFYAPGASRSGDFVDVTRMPNGLAAIIVGRVTSDLKRTAAALAEIRGAFRIAALHADAPKMQVRALNWLLSDKDNPCSCEAAVVVMNPKTGAFEISTAGPIGAVLACADGKAKALRLPDAPPVGNGQTIEYQGGAAKLGDGDTLVLFTAGTIDAEDDKGEKLGEKRLLDTLANNSGHSAEMTISEVTGDLAPYLKKQAPADDITILLAHRPAERA